MSNKADAKRIEAIYKMAVEAQDKLGEVHALLAAIEGEASRLGEHELSESARQAHRGAIRIADFPDTIQRAFDLRDRRRAG